MGEVLVDSQKQYVRCDTGDILYYIKAFFSVLMLKYTSFLYWVNYC